MQNNKVIKRILESVLVLVVIICGMFCLTACTDGGKINQLNSKLEKLEKQLNDEKRLNNDNVFQNMLNEANSHIQEQNTLLNNFEDLINELRNKVVELEECINGIEVDIYTENVLINELMLPKSAKCMLNFVVEDFSSIAKATNPIVREMSSVGLPYQDNFTMMEPEDVCGDASILSKLVVAFWLKNVMNNDTGSFECGKIYQDSNDSHGVTRQLIIEINFQKKTITGYMKMFRGADTEYLEITVNVNDNFTDWESLVAKNTDSNRKGMTTFVNGKKDGLVLNSYNYIDVDLDGFNSFQCYDLDTNYKMAVYNKGDYGMVADETTKAFLLNKYSAELNSTVTNVENAFNGKTDIIELDFNIYD